MLMTHENDNYCLVKIPISKPQKDIVLSKTYFELE